MSIIETLTEGIRQRSLANEGEALLEKWERTGLLEGLNDYQRSGMARLLENQAAQLLKETSTMQAGDVQGFAAVAFPLVRRVFGGLLAQDLVSVQPMSLPSGLIFFLDFVRSPDSGMTTFSTGEAARLGRVQDTSIYGGGIVGANVTGGVDLGGIRSQSGFWGQANGFSSPTGSQALAPVTVAGGTYGDAASSPDGSLYHVLRADPALVSGTSTYTVSTLVRATMAGLDMKNLQSIVCSGSDGRGGLTGNGYQARRLTSFSGSGLAVADNIMQVVVAGISEDGSIAAATLATQLNVAQVYYALDDSFVSPGPLGAIAGSTTNGGWGLENSPAIPSIDIKVDSLAVTAETKKLKAQWTPELAQDLNAYHNLDAEVELTSVLSEQIALEIDQEILSDLINGASAAQLWWSRLPGKFVNRDTGAASGNSLFPDFTGTVSEWYETLLETVNEVSARIHRKTLRGGANFLVCGPEVAAILEFTSGFRAAVELDDDKGSWGAMKAGSLSRKMDIFIDPYFMRNVILVGRRGSSFLESGYVYAPYVPLQVTPTIFGVDDFTPRKGVMTRYAKSMTRGDMYGLVIVADLVGLN
jgi:hypothetical protein